MRIMPNGSTKSEQWAEFLRIVKKNDRQEKKELILSSPNHSPIEAK